MKVWKQITLLTIILLFVMAVKVDAKADTYTYWDGYVWATASSNDYTSNPIEISFEVTYDYEEAYKMLEYVNEARREAGVQELILKDDLMDVAMARAAEGNIFFEHIRPDGSALQTLSYLIFGENMHYGSDDAQTACQSLIDSPGHYETMIDPEYKYVGFGKAGACWAQVFSVEEIYHVDGFDYKNPEKNKPVLWEEMTFGNRKNYTETVTVKVNPEKCNLYLEVSCSSYSDHNIAHVDETLGLTVFLTRMGPRGSLPFELPTSEYNVSFSNNLIDENFQCLKQGKTTVEISLRDYPQLKATKEITIKKNAFNVNGLTYKVTDYEKGEVALIKASSKKKSIKIPNKVKLAGMPSINRYKVTAIEEDAFRNNKKVKNVTISSNIKSIGKNAFYGCKNLNKITVKSTKITSVGKNAFKNIHKKAVIKVPKSRLTKYKKLFKNKGQKKTVKIKK